MAFRFKYACEFCGKEKVMTEEQAKTSICECETQIDLNYTWCEATEENYNALIRLGKLLSGYDMTSELYFLVENDKIFRQKNQYGDRKQIRLVNGKFEFVKENLETNILKQKYKSRDYILIVKQNGFENLWYKFNRIGDDIEEDLELIQDKRAKLIHKKHEDILNAYLKDNNVEIEVYEKMDNDYALLDKDFIVTYNENYLYRLKQKFPIFKYNKEDNMVVKFTNKNTSICVFEDSINSIGNIIKNDNLEDYNNEGWITLSYNKEKDLYNRQPVICWDDEDKLEFTLGYYNVEHDAMFTDYGKGYAEFDNIVALSKEQLKAFPEIVNNFKNLKGLLNG